MSNHVMPNPPVPATDAHPEADKEILIKENFNDELIKEVNSGSVEIILPDEVAVKERKKQQ